MESTFQVEKNVPMPKVRRNAVEYPFSEMEVGDSFPVKSGGTAQSCRVASRKYALEHNGEKFSTRKHGGAWRCWRIA